MSTVLITGATGKQGDGVIKNLLEKQAPFKILAVTRDVNSNAAKKLAENSTISPWYKEIGRPSIHLRERQNARPQPQYGVYSVLRNNTEKRQGIALIDASIVQNVKFFVCSSVDRHGPDWDHNPTQVPHFIYKQEIETHLRERTIGKNMKWTILRLVAFFENLTPDYFSKVLPQPGK